MEVRLSAATPSAGDHAVAQILIAIELIKRSWIVGTNTPLKARTSQFQLVTPGRAPKDSLGAAKRLIEP
jgi:hypothetical protein